jgi:hypothetical protein
VFRLQKGGRPPSHNPETLRGESLWFKAGIALLLYSTHPATLAAIGEGKFLSHLSLRTACKLSDGTLAAPERIHGPVWVVAPESPGP